MFVDCSVVLWLWSFPYITVLGRNRDMNINLYRSTACTSDVARLNLIFISPLPVKREGTIGLHSVRQSICLSRLFSVLFFDSPPPPYGESGGDYKFALCPSVSSVHHTCFLYFSLICFSPYGESRGDYKFALCPSVSSVHHTCFPDFSSLCFHISR